MTNQYIAHHGILGQRWGVRRYQNEDGSLTPAGRERYYNDHDALKKEGFQAIERADRHARGYVDQVEYKNGYFKSLRNREQSRNDSTVLRSMRNTESSFDSLSSYVLDTMNKNLPSGLTPYSMYDMRSMEHFDNMAQNLMGDRKFQKLLRQYTKQRDAMARELKAYTDDLIASIGETRLYDFTWDGTGLSTYEEVVYEALRDSQSWYMPDLSGYVQEFEEATKKHRA